MSPTYTSAIIIIAVTILKTLGIEIGNEQLTTTVETIVTLIAGIVIAYRRYTSKTQVPITIGGVRKANY